MNTIKRHFVTLISLVFLARTIYGQTLQNESLNYVADCNSFIIGNNLIVKSLENTLYLKVFAEKAYLYCCPDENCRIIDSVKFYDQIAVSKLINWYRSDTTFFIDPLTQAKSVNFIYMAKAGEWYKTPYKQTYAYIKKEDLAVEDCSNDGFLVGFTPIKNSLTIQLKTFDVNNNYQIKDSFSFQYFSDAYELQFVPYNGLKNSERLLRYQTFTQSCPEASMNEFIVFNQKGFIKLISGSSIGEGDIYDIEIIYFPMKFEYGKVLLVANGDHENIFNRATAELNVFQYPKNIAIPIEQLVVRTREHTEVVLDKKGQVVMVDEDNPKVKVFREKPKYYKWDGQTLTEI